MGTRDLLDAEDGPEQLASLPAFAPTPGVLLDPPLDPETVASLPPREPTSSPEDSASVRPGPISHPESDGTGRTSSSGGSGRRWRPGGDPVEAAHVIGGLIVLVTAALGTLAARRGRRLRQPTIRQRDNVAEPLGRIAVRYLPMDMLGPTFYDATDAAAAAHTYLMDGPLITRPAEPVEMEI